MNEDERKLISRFTAEGECCAAVLVRMGLHLRNEENEQFVNSVRALCLGLRSGMVCGALTGAVCMLGMFDPKNTEMIQGMTCWFRETYGIGEDFSCSTITKGDPALRHTLCPSMIIDTYEHAKKLLQDFGYIDTTNNGEEF